MTSRHRFSIGPHDEWLALTQWGEAESGKPSAMLLHGTGFCADVWEDVAVGLATTHVVYALDRRGHGDSHVPAGGNYNFLDFAGDVCRVIEALDLTDIFGVGHSAGATDLLLAAKLLPQRFSRLFVMEPTVMDPRAMHPDRVVLSDEGAARVKGAARRQAEFDSAEAAYRRYRVAPAFERWPEAALRGYIRHGFAALDDGRVRLRCLPEQEALILRPIYEAMEQVYVGDARGNPFAWLSQIECPVCIATAELSWPIYKDMSARAAALMPQASRLRFPGVDHCVAQEAPQRLLDALRAFEPRLS